MGLSCSFWSEVLPYESKRYLMRSMMFQSKTLESSLLLVIRTDSSWAACILFNMVRSMLFFLWKVVITMLFCQIPSEMFAVIVLLTLSGSSCVVQR